MSTDLAFVKDTTFDICEVAGKGKSLCEKAQSVAHQWRQAAHKGHLFDHQFVAIAAREAARGLNELATQVERLSSPRL